MQYMSKNRAVQHNVDQRQWGFVDMELSSLSKYDQIAVWWSNGKRLINLTSAARYYRFFSRKTKEEIYQDYWRQETRKQVQPVQLGKTLTNLGQLEQREKACWGKGREGRSFRRTDSGKQLLYVGINWDGAGVACHWMDGWPTNPLPHQGTHNLA